MIRRFLPLAFVLAIVATACSEAANPEIEFGSGQRFVPLVADPLNDAGVNPSVAMSPEGQPLVGYFAFEEETEEGELPATRPVGAPTLPGVLMATVNDEGIWSRGAIAIQAEIPTVTPPFAPAVEESVGELTARNVTGFRVVTDGDTFHAAWGAANGLWYATGSTDPASETQVEASLVTSTPARGLSIGLDGSSPVIAFYTSTSSAASVSIATEAGEDWSVASIADAAGCDACSTAVVPAAGGVAVAYSDGGDGVSIASDDGENGWVSSDVSPTGGAGLSGAPTADGVILVYYDGGSVTQATGAATGPFEASAIAEVADGTVDSEGARTSIATSGDGSATYLAWQDAEAGVRLASAGDAGFTPIETAPDTEGGEMPSVAVSEDGTRAVLAWYDPEEQDLLVGLYGEIGGLALAERSPTPSGPPVVVQPPASPDRCEPVVDGSVSVQASGIAFDTACLSVPAGEAFQIDFGNEDAGTPHNIAIYPSDQDLQDPLFQGEVITGPDSTTYDVDPLDAGEYYFQCDVHPSMSGTVQVGGGGGGAAGATGASGTTGSTGATGGTAEATGPTGGDQGGGGAGSVAVVAQGLAFDTSEISLPAGEPSTIAFDNQDAGVPHNIAIFASEADLTEALFRGDTITGPDQIDYEIPSLDAGEYYFHCDVHPTMSGSVTVA